MPGSERTAVAVSPSIRPLRADQDAPHIARLMRDYGFPRATDDGMRDYLIPKPTQTRLTLIALNLDPLLPEELPLPSSGGVIDHVDCTVIAEEPKIGPYRDAMRSRIAAILRLGESQVNVKATTTEGLGFTGRGEGIAAQAVASIRMASH